MNRHQRGHFDPTDLHRLLMAFGALAVMVVLGIGYGVYRLAPRLVKRGVVTLVLLLALLLWPLVFTLWLPFRRWNVPAWFEFKHGVSRLVRLIGIGTF